MSSIHRLAFVLAAAAIGTSGCAALKDEHSGHHPAASAAPAAGTGHMEAQKAAMRRMHERMMPAEGADDRGASMCDMGARQERMEKRMDMMVDMMGMMMDRLPPPPAK